MTDTKIMDNKMNQCSTFIEFIEEIDKNYRDMIAFKTHNQQWSYHDLSLLIQQYCPYFANSQSTYFCINIDLPVYFCAAFFAITISGKIAVLGSKELFSIDEAEPIDMAKLHQISASKNTIKNPILPDKNALSVIALSSGTTGTSKGVMLSQHNLLSNTFAGATTYGYLQNSVYLNILPYTHLFGIVADMLGPLSSGGTICFSDNKINFIRDMQIFKPTHLNLPPALVYTIEKAITQTQRVSYITGGKLEKIMCAGAKIDKNCINKMLAYGIEVLAAYGLTECSPCISMNSSNSWKIGSVGKVLPCCKVKIENDEILVHGDNVMLGYWNDETATKHVIRDGWLHTGDLGYIDHDGFLYLTGRISSIIVFENGEKLIPDIVEEDICRIQGIEESLLSSISVNNRILLQLTVVSTRRDDHLLFDINKCMEKHMIAERLTNIKVTTNPLEKNKLGKIIRATS